ncbi:rab11 family-interacting protein 3-like [Motacilla alba alba]|uniref:rab11 family-interacting protein 3-like n=1 Tax=Motacilla alba alba TaxID=1094192 RepID=UPI0018D5A2D3|nr:rab11 family-interacting protein 3-like [Motacilla alba alba]
MVCEEHEAGPEEGPGVLPGAGGRSGGSARGRQVAARAPGTGSPGPRCPPRPAAPGRPRPRSLRPSEPSDCQRTAGGAPPPARLSSSSSQHRFSALYRVPNAISQKLPSDWIKHSGSMKKYSPSHVVAHSE